jgi:hypothetical protein
MAWAEFVEKHYLVNVAKTISKNDCMALYQQFIADEFEHEIEALKSKSIQVLKENL